MTAPNADKRAEVAKPFGLVPHFVLLIKELTSGALWLYIYLCTRASRKTGLCRVSLHRAAREKDAEIRTVQVWRAQLESLGLVVTFQKTGRSSEFLVIRRPDRRQWAKQQNQLNLGPKRQKSRAFGRKGAQVKAIASQTNPISLPSESGFPPTEANPDSPITESKHSSVGNIEVDEDRSSRTADAIGSTSNAAIKNDGRSAKRSATGQDMLKPTTSSQGFDRSSWEEWLQGAFPGSHNLNWLMDQQERVMSELEVSSGEAQRILENCLRKAQTEGSAPTLQEIVCETIEALTQRQAGMHPTLRAPFRSSYTAAGLLRQLASVKRVWGSNLYSLSPADRWAVPLLRKKN